MRGRKLIEKTFGIHRDKVSYTDEQMDVFRDAIQAKYDSRDFESLVMMYSVLNLSLNTSLYAMMVFREMFLGPKTTSELQLYFKQPNTFGAETVRNETYQKAVKRMISDFFAYRAKTPIPSVEGADLAVEMQAFNDNIQKVNNICAQAAKSYNATAISHVGVGTFGIATPKDSLAKYSSDQYFIKVYGEKTESYLKAIRSSKLGILLFSDSFRERVGSFDAEACTQKAMGLTTEPITKADVMVGIDEVRSAFVTQIKSTTKDLSSEDPGDVIQKYLQAFPLTIQKVLNFAKSKKEDALLACGAMENLYAYDNFMQKLDIGLMAGGITAGVICAVTGIGVPATTAILGTFTLADVAAGGLKWAEGYTLENAVRGAAVSGQTTHVQGQVDLEKAKSLQSEGQWQVGLSAAGELGGYFGTKGVIYLRNSYRTKLARDFFKAQDEKVIQSVESIFSQPKYTSLNEDHLFQVLEEAKNANQYSDLPRKLKAIGLDDVDANSVTKMISKANEERLIFDELQGVLSQRKYAGKENQALVILRGVSKKGSVMRIADGVYYNSHERIAALVSARKELINIGFEPADADRMLNELFNEKTGLLITDYEKAVVGKYGTYTTGNPSATNKAVPSKPNLRISHTVEPVDRTLPNHHPLAPNPPRVVEPQQVDQALPARSIGLDDPSLQAGGGVVDRGVVQGSIAPVSEARNYFQTLTGEKKKAFQEVEKILFPATNPVSEVQKEKVYEILYHRAHVPGDVLEVRPSEFRPDPEKIAAHREAKRELMSLGYSQEEVNQVFSKLSNKNVMVLGNPKRIMPDHNVIGDPMLAAKHFESDVRHYPHRMSFENDVKRFKDGTTGLIYTEIDGTFTILQYEKIEGEIVITDFYHPEKKITISSLPKMEPYRFVSMSGKDILISHDPFKINPSDMAYGQVKKKFSAKANGYGKGIQESLIEDGITVEKIKNSWVLNTHAKVRLYTTKKGKGLFLKEMRLSIFCMKKQPTS